MDTSKMLHLENMHLAKAAELFSQSQMQKALAESINRSMEIALLRTQITELIDAHYNLGKVLAVYEIFGGYVNRSFGVYIDSNGTEQEYFLRKYKSGITEKEIRFEHKLIDFSIENGLSMGAGLVRTKDQFTYIRMPSGEAIDYYAIYQYLPGEDKYTWDNPNCNDLELASSAEVLAQFHNASRKFDPEGTEREEPKIMEFLLTRPTVFKAYAQRELSTKYHTFFLKNVDTIVDVINITRIPEQIWRQMPFNPCHNDFHPGNLKYSNNQAVGLFDFDWSKIELRLFDICLALVYFCSSWEQEIDGVLHLDKCSVFLKAYQAKLKALGGITPLTEQEKEYFPIMIAAANLYLVNWDVCAYYEGSDLNEYEYIAYLSHNVKLMKWIENHKEEIAAMIKSI